MRVWITAMALMAALTSAAAAQVIAPLRPYDPAVVRVAGRAELYLPPDQARVSVGFYNPARSATEATQAVSDRARALEAAIRTLNAETVAIERTDISVRPVVRSGEDRRPDRISGYEANASVTILVRDLALLGRAVEAGMNSAPDSFNDVEFSIRDTSAARRSAREAAIRDAVEKAQVYVEGAGFSLGRLLLVEEGGSNMIAQSGNRLRSQIVVTASEAPAPMVAPTIAPEPQLYTAEVSVVYEIGAARAAR